MVSRKTTCVKFAKTCLAAVLALGAATTAEAAIYWKGTTDSSWGTGGNWNGTSGRTYFFKSQNPATELSYLNKDYKGSFKWPSGGNAFVHGICFGTNPDSGPWRLHGTPSGTTYTFQNSSGSNYDTGIFCIGYSGQSCSARIYAIKLDVNNFTVGGDATLATGVLKYDMTGHLVLDDQNDDANGYLAPVTVTAKTCDFYNGDLYATNATITSSGNMTLYTFTAEKTGGDWTLNGDLIIGAKAGASATFTQNSGTVTVANNRWTKSTSGNGTLNLNGGTLVTQHLQDDTAGGSLTVNIDGGTIKVNNAHANGLIYHGNGEGLNVNVGANGGTIDTDGRDISIHVAVNAVENTTGAFTVTGGGSATFSAQGNLAGALTVGDGTALHWFDQDGAVSATCGFTSLALGVGSTIYLDGNATGVDVLPATATTTATAESKANIVINFSAIPATGASFTLFPTASADVFNVTPMFGSLVLPHEVAVVNGNLVLTIVAEDYTWNGSQTNWGDADAWTKGAAAATWADGNNAIFNTANATATLTADASPAKIDFTAAATVDGTATLTVPVVSVVPGVSATISAPTTNALAKTGAGTLVLGSSRTDETTVSEGTLAMANGATVVPANLTLGTDPTKPVVFDYGGQSFDAQLATFITPGANVTLTNIVHSNSGNMVINKDNAPSVLTVAKDATLEFADHATLNTDTETTLNIAGGTVRTKKNANNWLMQTSLTGRLNINVTDGGLLEFGGEAYLLTCRDAVDGSTDYQDPSLYFRVVDSTLRVLNTRSFRFGYDGYNKNPACPTGVFAATNSVIDIGYGISIGHNVVSNNTAGSYTADFENCVITAQVLKVYHDRPLNAIRLNNVRYTLKADNTEWLLSSSEFETMGAGGTAIKPITIDAGGLVLDTNGHNGDLQSDPQGAGAITKTGNGIFHIRRNQTSSSPLVCEEGETYVYDGLSVARAVTVRNGAKFTTKGVGQVALANISFEAGAELRVDEYRSGVVPIAVTNLTLPASGTVTLTKNNNFSQGKYRILEKTGIAVADVQDKLVPATTDSLAYSWSVEGNTLVLTVGNPTGFAWTGFAGDGKMSTDGNWLGNVAPGAGDPADFSAANMAITVEADIDATLGAVTMGSAVVTFTGSLTATSFSDNSKVEVGANSTVTLDGDLEFTSGDSYITYKVGDGGAFVVTGTIRATGSANVLPYKVASSGWIVAKGLENAETTSDKWNFRLNNSNVAKWVVGEDGFSGTQYFWSFNNANSDTTIKADADFTIATWLSAGTSNGKGVTFDTSGRTDPTTNYTITADCGFVGVKPLTIKGGGTFLCNYTPTVIANQVKFSGAVTVADAATLAINPGKYPTTGAITVNSGTTLQVAQSGTVTLGGNLTFKDGAALGFNYTTKDEPVLNLANKTVTFDEGETTNVVVKISSTNGKCGRRGPHALTSGGQFADATVSLAVGSPDWVKGVSVVDGEIVIDVKAIGTMVIVR